jgi:hypothetical protein
MEKSSSSPCAAGVINLEEQIRLPSPHRINVSIRLFIRLSIIYENTSNFHIGIKIRVSKWSFLSIVHPLKIPIPMYEKKVWIQHENSYKITYSLHVCITNLILALHTQSMNGLRAGGTFLRQQKKEKSSSSPCTAGVLREPLPGGTN